MSSTIPFDNTTTTTTTIDNNKPTNDATNDHKQLSSNYMIKLNTELTQRLTKLDETKLNQVIATSTTATNSVSTDILNNLFRKPLPKLSRKRISIRQILKLPIISRALQLIVTDLKLHEESNYDRRVEMFIGYCLYRNYALNTVRQYFNILKAHGVFGRGDEQSKLRLDSTVFIDRGRIHTRIVSMDNFKKFVAHLHEKISEYTAPILLAVYTGLRTAEILQFSAYTLHQLLQRNPTISIKRKQTVIKVPPPPSPPAMTTARQNQETTNVDNHQIYWTPIYNTHLSMFINILIDLYRLQYDALIQSNQNSKLFYCTPKTLGNRIKHLYYNACGSAAPNGFGVHSCRNMIAQLMAENTDNIVAIQAFLQHHNINTTRQYIKADFTYTTNTFNRLTNYEFSNVRANISNASPPSLSSQ